jgi:hypothetical protein
MSLSVTTSILSRHARRRLSQRTSLSPDEAVKLASVSPVVGDFIGSLKDAIICYSRKDKHFFVVIRGIDTGDWISVWTLAMFKRRYGLLSESILSKSVLASRPKEILKDPLRVQLLTEEPPWRVRGIAVNVVMSCGETKRVLIIQDVNPFMPEKCGGHSALHDYLSAPYLTGLSERFFDKGRYIDHFLFRWTHEIEGRIQKTPAGLRGEGTKEVVSYLYQQWSLEENG